MTSLPSVIHIVDDDPAVRDALSLLFETEGFTVGAYANAEEFLGAVEEEKPAAVLLDVHMPGRSGIDILKELNAEKFPVPIFIISGQGDIPMAVEAIKNGAYDFFEKPFDVEGVISRVREAISSSNKTGSSGNFNFPGAENLTPRERQVLGEITSGASNKEAGRNLKISPRTVEVHRARIMEKLGARNAADLVRIVLTGQN
ncbi:response regulator transcription factor [Rhodobacteraceae bacterium RKSG542]|uniref:response regulator transcription factor n=1 Tax=Pseudovibrio flavus TaxID=2529854 RepID=UPI0012BC1D6F|nr:response regulator [Pseudovibrio flavus]MTI18830.1 response regulator transcription factor [Pseudovibrio flavus]